jgi:hypothetical protein
MIFKNIIIHNKTKTSFKKIYRKPKPHLKYDTILIWAKVKEITNVEMYNMIYFILINKN